MADTWDNEGGFVPKEDSVTKNLTWKQTTKLLNRLDKDISEYAEAHTAVGTNEWALCLYYMGIAREMVEKAIIESWDNE